MRPPHLPGLCAANLIVIESEFTISAQHPALPGHFPGHPVVPGVVILDTVLCHIKAALPGRVLTALPGVKFLAPLLPEETVRLQVEKKNHALLGFSCHRGATLICHGQMRFTEQG